MFEFLFRYPSSAYSRGQLAFLSTWPVWLLAVAIAAAAGGLGFLMWQRVKANETVLLSWRNWVIWALQSALAALVLCLLWQPALVLNALKPQQNVIAVVIDDSRSMSLDDEGGTRIAKVKSSLSNGVLDGLKKRFQTRIYRMGDKLQRISNLDNLNGTAPTTKIGDGLTQLADESAGLPVGAVVLLTDGSDNSGGLESAVVSQLRGRRIPVHTVGFGKIQPEKDIEVTDVQVPGRALPDSRLAATVSVQSWGLKGQKTTIKVMGDGRLLAGKEITLGANGEGQTETVLFNAGAKGARSIEVRVEPVADEKNKANNALSRLVNVEDRHPRILYIEGEPRWEFKFLRRAVEDDKSMSLVTMLRTTQNKMYRQGIDNQDELAQGFPASVDELFGYQAIIIGSVELNYFTKAQQELIKQFVDRRGGGLIFLGSRNALSESGWDGSAMSDLLPVTLPGRKGTFHREPATAEVSVAGSDSVITRLDEDPAKNAERWKKLPYLIDYQDVGTPKPAATVLAELITPQKQRKPFVVTQNYGRGRVAVVAGSTWRWQMLQALEDTTHEMFWRQMLRWAVSDTPGRVLVSSAKTTFSDNGRLRMVVDVRDKNYLPASDAHVEARIVGPGGESTVELHPDPVAPGEYRAEWTAEAQGQYAAEVTALRGTDDISRDVLTFQRQDGIAEAFHTQQNKELLERLSEQTGGQYWTPDTLSKLPDEISYSDAGVTVRETRDLWNLPIVFLLLIALRASEWLLRRKWGVV
jgi:uncharacterized membrane protein